MTKNPKPTPYSIKMDGCTIGTVELLPMSNAEREVVRRHIANEYDLQPRFIRLVEAG